MIKNIKGIKNITNVVEKFKSLNKEQILFWKYFCFGVIIFDLFGLYWYFKLKLLAKAILLVTIGFLTIFLYLEKNYKEVNKKMFENIFPNEESKEESMDTSKEIPKKNNSFDLGFGLPTSESINKGLMEFSDI